MAVTYALPNIDAVLIEPSISHGRDDALGTACTISLSDAYISALDVSPVTPYNVMQ